MELNINSPAYFTDHYGIDEEVYKYCQQLHDFFRTREYSESMNIIGITPVIAPKEIYDQGMWKEKVQVVLPHLLTLTPFPVGIVAVVFFYVTPPLQIAFC